MKKATIILGFLVLAVSLYNISPYLTDYAALAEYGKGYVWGNIILLMVACILLYVGYRRKKAKA
ncbi:hypothetical protein [Negadavirga shengliensis]|uniref:LPXTG-motif cell wall anchor domain-containing protein n=1 Tax=Negadavirga shengliensis TaxID=1389218 RepID=A0ABV9T6X4_9BACT